MATTNDGQFDPKKLLEEMLQLDLSSWNTQVVMAARDSAAVLQLELIPLADGLPAEFRGIVQTTLHKRKMEHEKHGIDAFPYSASFAAAKHQVECLQLSAHGAVGDQIRELADVHSLPEFKGTDAFIKNLKFYAIVLTPPAGGDPLVAFRAYTPKRQLKKSGWIGIFLTNGAYASIEETAMLFDNHVDCLSWKGQLLIFRKDSFHKIFQFYSELVKTAKATLDVIKQHVPIEGFDQFALDCENHLVKLAKLKNIAQSPYLKTLTIKDYEKVINLSDKIKVKVVGKAANKKLAYDPSDRWGILKLLDDDYLQSILTKRQYEVNSKLDITQ